MWRTSCRSHVVAAAARGHADSAVQLVQVRDAPFDLGGVQPIAQRLRAPNGSAVVDIGVAAAGVGVGLQVGVVREQHTQVAFDPAHHGRSRSIQLITVCWASTAWTMSSTGSRRAGVAATPRPARRRPTRPCCDRSRVSASHDPPGPACDRYLNDTDGQRGSCCLPPHAGTEQPVTPHPSTH
jgi:hypothetical protein